MDSTNKVLLWSTFVFIIIILAYVGAANWAKEGLVIHPPANGASSITDVVSKNDVNVYFPETIWITFNDIEKRKKGSNIYQPAEYNNWSTPNMTADYRTTNMFSAHTKPDTRFVGVVNNEDPFSTTAPPSEITQFGPTSLEPYNS